MGLPSMDQTCHTFSFMEGPFPHTPIRPFPHIPWFFRIPTFARMQHFLVSVVGMLASREGRSGVVLLISAKCERSTHVKKSTSFCQVSANPHFLPTIREQ